MSMNYLSQMLHWLVGGILASATFSFHRTYARRSWPLLFLNLLMLVTDCLRPLPHQVSLTQRMPIPLPISTIPYSETNSMVIGFGRWILCLKSRCLYGNATLVVCWLKACYIREELRLTQDVVVMGRDMKPYSMSCVMVVLWENCGRKRGLLPMSLTSLTWIYVDG